MNRLTLLTANLTRKPARTALTVATVVVAFFLFMLLRAIANAFAGGVTAQSVSRLYVDARYSMTDNLPIATCMPYGSCLEFAPRRRSCGLAATTRNRATRFQSW